MRRKKRLISVAVIGGVILLSALGLGGAILGGRGDALANAFKDPLDMLGWRSPGTREPGALFQTKNPASRKAPAGPRERVLAQMRERPEAPGEGAAPGNFMPMGAEGPIGEPGALPAGPEAGPVGFPEFPQPGFGLKPKDSSSSSSSSGSSSTSSTSSSSTSSSSSSSSSGGPPSSTSSSSSGGDIPAVPEPSTWVMLGLGMFAMGAALRHARRFRRPDGDGSSASPASAKENRAER